MFIPFGAWRPDVSDYRGQHSKTISNVLPRGDGYGPFPGFSGLSSALAAACRGAFFARKSDGSVVIFAGTSTKLYMLSNTDLDFDDVSKSAGTYTALPSTDQWQFAQFGNFVFAVQANVAPQVYEIGTSTEFADLGGSPPQARYVAVVNRFLVLSGLTSNPFRVHWSGLNATTTWTSGTNSSDYQDFADGGIVRGVAGGEVGVIFQDGVIRRMIYAPGSPVIFQIERVTRDIGLYAPLSLTTSNNKVYFLASQGFYEMEQTGFPVPIGRENFDRTFFAEYDRESPQMMLGVSDPKAGRVLWSYKTTNGTAGQFNKLICYDTLLKRATPITQSGEYLCSMAQPGITLESLDSVEASIDDLTQSLDSFNAATISDVGVVDTSHALGLFRGSALEATLDTSEHAFEDSERVYVTGIRPVTDAPTVYASIAARETAQDTSTLSAESLINSNGECPVHISTRYARERIRIPADTIWTFASGVEVPHVKDGWR